MRYSCRQYSCFSIYFRPTGENGSFSEPATSSTRWWDWRFCSLVVLSTIVDYFCGISIAQSNSTTKRKFLLGISLCVNLSLLGTFKYFDFFVESAAGLLQSFGFQASTPTLNIILPVGISFYTFQTLSYTIDVYRGSKPERSFIDFANFVVFFPQLVAGPIIARRRFDSSIEIRSRGNRTGFFRRNASDIQRAVQKSDPGRQPRLPG